MLKKMITLLIVMLIISTVNFAQSVDYVEYSLVEGELTPEDQYKKEFGRYDGFEVPLNAGENVYLSVYSEDFNPSLLLVNPKEEKFEENQARGTGFASIKAKIPETGVWYVYVIGTANSKGNYYYQNAFADDVALKIPSEKTFKNDLQYILKHSRAYFLFLENEGEIYKIAGAEDAFIDGNDASYNAVLADGENKKEIEKKYQEYSDKLIKTLSGGWNVKNSDWVNIEDYKQKKAVFTPEDKNKEYMVTLKLNNYSQGNNGDYSLELVIMNTK